MNQKHPISKRHLLAFRKVHIRANSVCSNSLSNSNSNSPPPRQALIHPVDDLCIPLIEEMQVFSQLASRESANNVGIFVAVGLAVATTIVLLTRYPKLYHMFSIEEVPQPCAAPLPSRAQP